MLVTIGGLQHGLLGHWISQLPSHSPRVVSAVLPFQGLIESWHCSVPSSLGSSEGVSCLTCKEDGPSSVNRSSGPCRSVDRTASPRSSVEEQRTNIRMAGDWREISQGRSGLSCSHQSTEAVDKLGDNLTASPVKFPQQLLTPRFAYFLGTHE